MILFCDILYINFSEFPDENNSTYHKDIVKKTYHNPLNNCNIYIYLGKIKFNLELKYALFVFNILNIFCCYISPGSLNSFLFKGDGDYCASCIL